MKNNRLYLILIILLVIFTAIDIIYLASDAFKSWIDNSFDLGSIRFVLIVIPLLILFGIIIWVMRYAIRKTVLPPILVALLLFYQIYVLIFLVLGIAVSSSYHP
jgi:hypothetical protein